MRLEGRWSSEVSNGRVINKTENEKTYFLIRAIGATHMKYVIFFCHHRNLSLARFWPQKIGKMRQLSFLEKYIRTDLDSLVVISLSYFNSAGVKL